MNKNFVLKLIASCCLTLTIANCGQNPDSSRIKGLEPGIAGQMLYRYTVNDPDPNFRLGSAARVTDLTTTDDVFSYIDPNEKWNTIIVWGPYLTLNGGGMFSAEVDFELVNTDPSQGYCILPLDLRMQEGRVNLQTAQFSEGVHTWKSNGVPFDGTADNIEVRAFTAQRRGYSADGGPFDCIVKLKEIRIIHRTGL
jgi:hypothetical protein